MIEKENWMNFGKWIWSDTPTAFLPGPGMGQISLASSLHKPGKMSDGAIPDCPEYQQQYTAAACGNYIYFIFL